jgi:hypothetical protein
MTVKSQVKTTCLILFSVALLAVLLTGDRTIRTANAFSEGPNAGVTGAPGETTCAVVGCHGGVENTGPGQILILAPTSYEPGKTYEITVKHMTSDSTRQRWGFQLTALNGNAGRAGDLQGGGGVTQVLEGGPDGNRQYIEHNFLGTFQGLRFEASWTFNWVAPSSDVGPVTMYAAGNEANNNGNETGDQIYSTTATIAPAVVLTGPPAIDNATVSGKRLILGGTNFGDGVTLFMDGERVRKVFNDEENPRTVIVARKAGKLIAPGQTVMLKIVNPSGAESNVFSYTRPAE